MTLRDELSTPEGKGRYARRLFATIADRYDFITAALSYGQDRRWKRRVIAFAALSPDDTVLDLASGTGDLAQAARASAARVVGLDITMRMLQLAAGRFSGERQRYALVQGDMMTLPFADGRFTVVTTGYGLRNVPDLSRAIREISRVLAAGGRLVSLDFNRPEGRILRAAYLAYLEVVGSIFGWALHGDPNTYRYIPASIRTYPGAKGVAELLRQAGFADVRVFRVLGPFMAIHVARKAAPPG